MTWILASEIGFVTVVLAVLVGATGVRLRRHRVAGERLPEARAALGRVLDGCEGSAEGRYAFACLPAHVKVGLVADASRVVGGAGRARLEMLAREDGLLTDVAALCTSRRWWRRVRGLRLLTLAGARDPAAVGLLTDRHEEVRAAAATWASAHAEPAIIERLLSMLDDERPICRFAAKSALLRIGRPVVAPLMQRLSSVSGGSGQELMEVAVGVAEAPLMPVALQRARDHSPRVRALAAALAGSIGGGQAADVLTAMLDDEDSSVRASAAVALGKLEYWPAAPRLAAALRDRAWEVRQASALSLRAIGPTGLLLLRECLGDTDAFARDMAQQVLDLPVPASR